MKNKLTRWEKEKMLLSWMHNNIHEDKTQYGNDLDLFSVECSRFLALNGNKIAKRDNIKSEKWLNIKTGIFGGKSKHVLRDEFINFKISHS